MPLMDLRTFELGFYAAVFFGAMVVHELALEGASKAFPDLDSLASAVTLVQFGSCFGLPILLSRGEAFRTFPRTLQQAAPYARLSLLVAGATALATRSLVYVSYPTKIVVKSAKMIPTMAVDVFLDRRKGLAWNHKYGPTDCVCALLLCAGAAGFAYVDRAPAADPGHTRSSRTGLAMLAVSVVCDALVPNLQKRLMCSHGGGPSEHSSISISSSSQGSSSPSGSPSPSDSGGSLDASELMVNVNGVGVAGLMAWMAGSGSLAAVNDALQAGPELGAYLACVGLGLGAAVLAYTKLIQVSGPAVAVGVATLRKAATVLLSYAVYDKPLAAGHLWAGAAVALALALRSCPRHRAPVRSLERALAQAYSWACGRLACGQAAAGASAAAPCAATQRGKPAKLYP